MGNRPINRRPWRKRPWGKRRPTRWNASFNSANEDAVLLNTAVLPALDTVLLPPTAVLVSGQVDVEPWADDQEVTIDRVVGNISLHGYWTLPNDSALFKGAYVKMGLVLNEEISDSTSLVELNLFNQETLEDREWMWLWSGFPDGYVASPQVTGGGNGLYHIMHNIPIDLRNRRKIGQTDELSLYVQFAAAAPGYDVSIQCITDVRAILMSR